MTKRKKDQSSKLVSYFVPAPPKTVPESPLPRAKKKVAAQDDAGTKYFIPPAKPKRNYPLPSELPELWDGTGPDLPTGYAGNEGCPDCSTFKYTAHAPMCIRNPRQGTYNLVNAWNVIRVRGQVFFGAGHPVQYEIDSYMTQEKQRRLSRAGIVVMYDYPAGDKTKGREVIADWTLNVRK